MLSTGVSFPLLCKVMPLSLIICSVYRGWVKELLFIEASLVIYTPRKAETSPSSFSLKVLDRDWMTLH
jgi:hypothetical protein